MLSINNSRPNELLLEMTTKSALESQEIAAPGISSIEWPPFKDVNI
jgi:hypothetical protein